MDEPGKAISRQFIKRCKEVAPVLLCLKDIQRFRKRNKGNGTLDCKYYRKYEYSTRLRQLTKQLWSLRRNYPYSCKGRCRKKTQDILINSDTEDIIEFCDAVVACIGRDIIKDSDMLPVLKQAGRCRFRRRRTYDILRGAIDALKGKSLRLYRKSFGTSRVVKASTTATEEDIKFGYCTGL